MPFIRITVSGTTLSPRQIDHLQQRTTALMGSVLGKRRDVTSVLVDQPAGGWAIGGTPAGVAAHVDAKITLGTNTQQEKARFVSETMLMLREALGEHLNPCTYVVIDEIPGDAWGYGGLTQDHRRLAARSAAASAA